MNDERFDNKENTPHNLEDGRILWESRSCAVVGAVVTYVGNQETPMILLAKRGPICPDEVGKFCMPCGFLDWNESGTDGARRETWEETGVFIDEGAWRYEDQPWRVAHWKHTSNQNVSLHFLFENKLLDDKLPSTSIEECEPGEVTEVRWVPIGEAVKMDLAFNHHEVLKELADRKGWNSQDVG